MDGDYDTQTGEILSPPMAAPYRWSSPASEVFAALAKAQAEIKNAAKDSKNPHFNSRYADLASVKDACWEQLTKNGIAVIQMPINGAGSNIGLVTVFAHTSGQWIESTVYVAPTKFDAQGLGSAITYLRRYALGAMAGVAPEDDDGNAAVGKPSGGPGAQGSAGGARSAPQRQQAAPAPSAAKLESDGRYNEIRDAIDAELEIPHLVAWPTSPAWDACRAAIARTVTEMGRGEAAARESADISMHQLELRIEKRKALLADQAGLKNYEV